MTTSRKTRLLALAVQRFGADSGTVRSLLEDSRFGLDTTASDRVLAQCLALYDNDPMKRQPYTVEQYVLDHQLPEEYTSQVLKHGRNYEGYAVVPVSFGHWAKVMVYRSPDISAVAESGFNSVAQAIRAIKTMHERCKERD